MLAAEARLGQTPLHPLHAVLLAGSVTLFVGALLSDWRYSSTYEVQWINFASWLNAGALVFAGLALLWALIDLVRPSQRRRRSKLYFILLLATFVTGFIGALVHSRDAWGTMPDALILSSVVALLAVVTTWIGFTPFRARSVT